MHRGRCVACFLHVLVALLLVLMAAAKRSRAPLSHPFRTFIRPFPLPPVTLLPFFYNKELTYAKSKNT